MKAASIILSLLLLVSPAFAADPPPLEKTDAQRIMEAMDWTEVTIIAVRQGVAANGMVAPIYGTIVGLGTLHGEHHSINQTIYYDKDLDWYALELGERSARLWNKTGFQPIKPWGLW